MNPRESERLLLEMEAMAKVAEIINALPNQAQGRVAQWAADYFAASDRRSIPMKKALPSSSRAPIDARPAPKAIAPEPDNLMVIESFEELAAAAEANTLASEAAALNA